MNILELKEVSTIYGDVKALDNVSMSVEEGEWLAIMGPSGSGKTTMMNIIGCMDKPSAGQVILEGADLSRESDGEPDHHPAGQDRPYLSAVSSGEIPDRPGKCYGRPVLPLYARRKGSP